MSTKEEYELTDFDYSEEEKELLVKVRKGKKYVKHGKRELLTFNDSSEDDRCQTQDKGVVDFINDSDLEDGHNEDDDVLDTMNWGDNRRTYYNTDFVDKDYTSFYAQEEELARAEEEEAINIQLRLVKQLSEADYDLGSIQKVAIAEEDNTHSKELLSQPQSIHFATNVSGLLQRERLQLFFKDSPEFNGLRKDFKNFLDEVNALIWPVFEYIIGHKLPIIPALKFTGIYKNILMTFCSNVALYLLLKAKRIAIKNHPVIKRLVQLRQLLEQLNNKYDIIIKPQLKALLQRIEDGDKFEFKMPETTDKHKKKRKLKLEIFDEHISKNNKGIENKKQIPNLEELSRDGHNENFRNAEGIGETRILQENGKLRRVVTYQIAKNKGLIPHRKKEQRNPRVKHRGKYRKALIRRKGTVRTLCSKVQRYDGEVSGIKATVSRSIKFKS